MMFVGRIGGRTSVLEGKWIRIGHGKYLKWINESAHAFPTIMYLEKDVLRVLKGHGSCFEHGEPSLHLRITVEGRENGANNGVKESNSEPVCRKLLMAAFVVTYEEDKNRTEPI
jgi:hypothetical protein